MPWQRMGIAIGRRKQYPLPFPSAYHDAHHLHPTSQNTASPPAQVCLCACLILTLLLGFVAVSLTFDCLGFIVGFRRAFALLGGNTASVPFQKQKTPVSHKKSAGHRFAFGPELRTVSERRPMGIGPASTGTIQSLF